MTKTIIFYVENKKVSVKTFDYELSGKEIEEQINLLGSVFNITIEKDLRIITSYNPYDKP